MSDLQYSFIIPVYNRPEEIEDLLKSFTSLNGNWNFEIVIVEDGSNKPCDYIVNTFKSQLNITYFFKPNSGPGDSRNKGMSKASGNYFIILDSDVILNPDYLTAVDAYLNNNFVHCFGGPDGASEDFNDLQKAINFSMTSLWTTGGIRGHASLKNKNYEARSFNMGLSKQAFTATGGFGKIHPGEDPDLVLKLKKLGYEIAYISKALVYHKRRISWLLFFKQVFKFGSVRPILNHWHPGSRKLTYWFPTVFVAGFLLAFLLASIGVWWSLIAFGFYYLLVLIDALMTTRSFKIGVMSLLAVTIQFCGYGYGFIKSTIKLGLNSKKTAEQLFPNLFFK